MLDKHMLNMLSSENKDIIIIIIIIFQSCRDGAIAYWVLPVLFGR